MSVIDVLADLIKIDSRNPFKIDTRCSENTKNWLIDGNETAIMQYIEQRLKKIGFKIQRQFVHKGFNNKSYYNLLAEKGTGEKSILFYAHMDTVSAQPWLSEEDAFRPTILKKKLMGKEREVMVGLGSNDMKAGIAVLLEAFQEIEPEDIKIKLAFGVDEEFYSLGANILAKSKFMDDVEAVIVSEIGDGPNEFFGPGTIGLGRLGRCEFIFNVPGTGGHGAISMDPTFVNAAVEAAKIAMKLEELREKHNDEFQFFSEDVPDGKAINKIKGSFFVSKIQGGNGSLSIPSSANLIVDYTFTPNKTVEMLLKEFREMIEDMYNDDTLKKTYISGKFKKISCELRSRPTPFSNAYITDENNSFVQFVKSCVEKTIGFKNYNMGYSVADENVFSRENPDIPVLVLGPIGEFSHKADEWVDIESVHNLVKLYQNIIKDFILS